MTQSKQKAEFRVTPATKDLPATQGMLALVRSELKAEARSLKSEMKAGFNEVDARFNEVDARFKGVDARFDQVDARFNPMDAKFEQVLSEISRVGQLVEEQNSRNQVVLEGLTALWQRQDRVETRTDQFENRFEKWVRSISQPQRGGT